jgi:hypothetical protein
MCTLSTQNEKNSVLSKKKWFPLQSKEITVEVGLPTEDTTKRPSG